MKTLVNSQLTLGIRISKTLSEKKLSGLQKTELVSSMVQHSDAITGSPSDTYNCVYCNELPLTNDELDSVINHYTNSVGRAAVLTSSNNAKLTYQTIYKSKLQKLN